MKGLFYCSVFMLRDGDGGGGSSSLKAPLILTADVAAIDYTSK
jgi:hypothetical protein